MIGRLNGVLLEKNPPDVLIDVGGVGYNVAAPMSTFSALPELNEKVTLHIHMVVREDAQLLYGFFTTTERELFRSLIKVSGVGPKLAITILSGMNPEQFVSCVKSGDTKSLQAIPGVGKKTAERLIVEISDTLSAWSGSTNSDHATSNTIKSGGNQKISDAVSALVNLGYKQNSVEAMVKQLDTEVMTSEEIIRFLLKQNVRV